LVWAGRPRAIRSVYISPFGHQITTSSSCVKYPVVVSGSHAEEPKEAEGESIRPQFSAATGSRHSISSSEGSTLVDDDAHGEGLVAMPAAIKNRITDMCGIEYPIVQGGMHYVG
jgi:hypothetical protein